MADDDATKETLTSLVSSYQHLISASEVHVQSDKTGIEDNAVSVVIDKATIYMPLADLVDLAKKRSVLKKKRNALRESLRE